MHGSFHRVFETLLFHEASGIRKWETRFLKKASHIIAVSGQDADKLIKISGKNNVTVVPNGVDASWFTFSDRRFVKGRMHILFTGNFYWFPNREALSQIIRIIWPQIHKHHPNARLTIAGTNIPGWQDVRVSLV